MLNNVFYASYSSTCLYVINKYMWIVGVSAQNLYYYYYHYYSWDSMMKRFSSQCNSMRYQRHSFRDNLCGF